MARYVDVIDLPIPIEEAFDYLANFSHTAEWDPGVSSARRISRGEIGVGSRFRVKVSFFGREIPFEYEITEMERPTRIVFCGGDPSMRSIDELTFAAKPGGTRVTYEARLELEGIRRLADPLLHLVFQHIGQQAVSGLRRRFPADELGIERERKARRPKNRSTQKGVA